MTARLPTPTASPTVAGKVLQNMFNVRDYGAKGDGTTDDTAAFSSAWTALKAATGPSTLFVPRGTYLTTGVVFQTFSNFVIRGERGSVIWTSPATVGDPQRACHHVVIVADCTDFSIEDLTVDARRDTINADQYLTANAASAQATVTVQDGTKYVVGEYVSVFGGSTANGGIEKNFNDSNFHISSIAGNVLTLNSNITHAYTATGASGGAYLTRYQTGNASLYSAAGRSFGNEDSQCGFMFLSCQRFRVAGCAAMNTWESPFKFGTGFAATATTDGCSYGLVSGCHAKHGFDQGFSSWFCSEMSFVDNWASGAGWAGLCFSHCKDSTATGNITENNTFMPPFDQNGGSGFAIEGGINISLVGNTTTGNFSNGIRITQSPLYTGTTTTTSAYASGTTSIVTAGNGSFAAGSSHTIIDPGDPTKLETIYCTAFNSTTKTVTLANPLRHSYATGANIQARYGEGNIVSSNTINLTQHQAGIQVAQQIGAQIVGNDILDAGRGSAGDTSGAYGIQIEQHSYGTVVSNNTVRHPLIAGIYVDSDCANIVISSNNVYGAGAQGIKVRGAFNVSIVGNVVSQGVSDGIYCEDNSGVYAQRLTIQGNICSRNAGSGIYLNIGGGNHSVQGNTSTYNTISGLQMRGVANCTVSGNIFANNSQYGICMLDDSTRFCTKNIVIGNLLYDDQGTATQTYGISEQGSSGTNQVAYNRIYGNTQVAQYQNAASSTYTNNIVS